MEATPRMPTLITAIADLDEETTLRLVHKRLAGSEDPLLIMEDCQKGLRLVGERYEQGHYFLAALIMGGEILRQVMELVQPAVRSQITSRASGRVLLGTVEGDIHDLGKGIVGMLLGCHKITAYDLGVDVSPARFVAGVGQVQPDIVGLSGLLTSSYDSMRQTVAALRDAAYHGPIIIGGGQLNQEVCQYVGADYWTTDAVAGVEVCQQLINSAESAA
jgi:methanogenic corrinoid protein MtbC1